MEKVSTIRSELVAVLLIASLANGAILGVIVAIFAQWIIGPQVLAFYVVIPMLFAFVFAARAAYLTGLQRLDSVGNLNDVCPWIPKTHAERAFTLAGALLAFASYFTFTFENAQVAHSVLPVVCMLAVTIGITATNRYPYFEIGVKRSAQILFIAFAAYLATMAVIALT